MMNVIRNNLTPKAMRMNILRLSWPAILRLSLQSLVGFVDVIMVSKLGDEAVGAVDISNRIAFIIIGVFTALSIGSTALVAHHIGAGNKEKGNEVLWQSLLIAMIMAIVFLVVGLFFSRYLLEGMLVLMQEKNLFIINEGSIYLKIVLASMVFGFPLMIMNAVFQGVGDMKTPMILMIITNITNVLFNWLLIFGIWIFPELGVAGAGLGSALGRFFGFLLGLFILIKGKSNLKLAFKYLKFKFDMIIVKSIFVIGIPSSLEQLARQSSQIIITVLVAGLNAGDAALAANAVAMNVNMLTIMPGFGFSVAAVTLVGQSLGAERKDLAERYAKQSTRLATILMIPASIIMFLLARPLVSLFDISDEAIPLAVTAVRIIIVSQPILTIVMVLAGGLRGAGDTTYVMKSTFIGNFVARIAIGFLLGYYLGMGLAGFWIGIAIDITVRAILLMIRFKSGKWKDIRVIRKKDKLQEVLD